MARMATTYGENGPETFMGAVAANEQFETGFPELSQNTHVRDLQRHDKLFFEGDEASCFYEVLDGVVCVYKLLPDGRRHVMNFCFAGDLIALSAQGEHRYNAEAIETSRVRCIPKMMLAKVIQENPVLASRVIEAATTELAEARNQVLTVSRRSAKERIASFLVGLSKRNEKRGEDEAVLNLPMTRLDIADFLGLTLETVSRTISKLKNAGVIDLPHSSVVVVRDMGRLESLAEV